jgi:hypothetical protein
MSAVGFDSGRQRQPELDIAGRDPAPFVSARGYRVEPRSVVVLFTGLGPERQPSSKPIIRVSTPGL